jgi:hypothetical protein
MLDVNCKGEGRLIHEERINSLEFDCEEDGDRGVLGEKGMGANVARQANVANYVCQDKGEDDRRREDRSGERDEGRD